MARFSANERNFFKYSRFFSCNVFNFAYVNTFFGQAVFFFDVTGKIETFARESQNYNRHILRPLNAENFFEVIK